MSTLTAVSDEEEAPSRMGRIDEAALAATREERFRRRQARIAADPALDPRVKALYLDRAIWNSARVRAELGMVPNSARLSVLRGGGANPRGRLRHPHPMLFPDMDTVEGYVADVPQPGVEAGRVREWVVKRGTHLLDPDTGALVRTSSRHGRKRANRPTLGRKHIPKQQSKDED